MSIRTHILAQGLLAKSSVAECSVDEIRDLVNAYPYYAPAQFLLLEKFKQISDPAYVSQLQKSVLYFHDPLVFEYFISPDKFYSDLPLPKDNPPFDPESLQDERQSENLSEGPEISIPPALHTNDETLAFEPFHTVDYFASQGIKLSQEDLPKDKLGKQLKSFTEWLKTMKRLPQQQLDKNLDPDSEKRVQNLANDSVHDPLVLTESMAEVWLKQGNLEKAIEVYNKLSLLNPSKMAYFAAKIDQIKH
ncbi:MAG: hypothetical protein NVS1B13_12390 [Flavisolibacter sp.]